MSCTEMSLAQEVPQLTAATAAAPETLPPPVGGAAPPAGGTIIRACGSYVDFSISSATAASASPPPTAVTPPTHVLASPALPAHSPSSAAPGAAVPPAFAADQTPCTSTSGSTDTGKPPMSKASCAGGQDRAAAASPSSAQGATTLKKRLWDAEVENALLQACLAGLNYAACRDLERRVRSGSGTEDRGRLAPCCPPPDEACAADAPRAAAAAAASPSAHSCTHGDSCCSGKECSFNGGCSTESKGAQVGHNASFPAAALCYKFKKDPEDRLGELLDHWLVPERLCELLDRIAERAARAFSNVVASGAADGLDLPERMEEIQLRQGILREATIREVQLRISEEIHAERVLASREGGMIANPSAYKQGHLSHLLPETIAALMKDGVGVQYGFMGEKVRRMILNEIELLEYDGKFNEVFQQSINPVRKDYMYWARLCDLDRETQQGMWRLFESMQALPFELNKKAHLYLQSSWVFHLAVFQNDGAYYRRHMDGSFMPGRDNGRKITAIYYPNPDDWQPSDGGYLRVYGRWRRREQLAATGGEGELDADAKEIFCEVKPAGDTLVLLRSREMRHEVLETHRKRFAITLWISGPPGPGDD